MPRRTRKVTVTGKQIEKRLSQQDKETLAQDPNWVNPETLPLTEQQELFCREYVRCRYNGTRAAKAAGYAESNARVQASQLLTKPNISRRINELKDKCLEKLDYSVERVLQEYCKLAFVNMDDFMTLDDDGGAFVDLSKLTREQAAAIAEITTDEYKDGRDEDAREIVRVKFKLHDKTKALDALARFNKMFVEQKQFLGADGKPINPPALQIAFVEPKKES